MRKVCGRFIIKELVGRRFIMLISRLSTISRSIPVLILVFFLSIPAQAKYSGGSGTSSDPYKIGTVADWQTLMNSSADWNKNFIMTADIDVNGLSLTPVGTSSNYPFTGIFNGNGHIISNADVNMPNSDYVGLFGYIGNSGQIKKLGLENVKIVGNSYVGGLVGYNSGTGIVTDCYSTGIVSGESFIGGLMGSTGGNNNVTNCYSNSLVSGNEYIGGLAGFMCYSRLTNCYSTGTVSGQKNVGGLVGFCTDGDSLYCIWDIETSGLSGSSGGVGLTTAEMMDPYMLGLNGFANNPNWVLDAGKDYPRLAWQVTPGEMIPEPNINWLIGNGTTQAPYQIDIAEQLIRLSKASILFDKKFILDANINLDPNLYGNQIFGQSIIQTFKGVFDGNNHTISNIVIEGGSYLGVFGRLESGAEVKNLGIVNTNISGSSDYIGGLVGINGGNVTNCYSTGSVTSLDWYAGGLVGINGGNVTNCHSISLVSGNKYIGGLVGYNGQYVTNCYSSGTVSGTESVGGLVGYNIVGIVTNCNSNSTIISSQSYYIGGLVGYNDLGIVTNCYFTGTVSGKQFIGGLVGVNHGDMHLGSKYGSVTNCYSTGAVSGKELAGGLVGYNYEGTVTNSYSTGTISGENYVGGLAGTSNGILGNCYSTVEVSGEYRTGGLVGNNIGTITNCYSTGAVSGEDSVGGFVGANYGTLTNCYSIGTVRSGNYYVGGIVGYNSSNVKGCFWDVETSLTLDGVGNQNPDPNGVIGKTTAQMKTKSTFTGAGWDFVGETVNGRNDIWYILEGKDYPKLWWQLPVDDFNDCNAAPLWTAYQLTPELAYLTETNGRLEVNNIGSLDYTEALYISDGWRLDANKPFAFKVDYHFSKLGSGNGKVILGLGPNFADPNAQWAQFEAGSANNYAYYSYIVTDGNWVDVQVWNRVVNDGVLYISYDPNSDKLYFSNSGYGADKAAWTVTGLIRGKWHCKSLCFTLGGGSQAMVLTGKDAWLDNFRVDEGAIFQ
jgi:hypothetical protein